MIFFTLKIINFCRRKCKKSEHQDDFLIEKHESNFNSIDYDPIESEKNLESNINRPKLNPSSLEDYNTDENKEKLL